MNRGKLAVLSILLLGVVLAGFALWWNIASGRRALQFWGTEGARRIINDEAQVVLLWLRPASGDADQDLLTMGQQTYAVSWRVDVTGARGLVHARHSLMEDASFRWDPPVVTAGDYTAAVRFRDAAGTTTVAFDFQREQMAHVESGRQQRAAAKIVAGWKSFAERHAADSGNK